MLIWHLLSNEHDILEMLSPDKVLLYNALLATPIILTFVIHSYIVHSIFYCRKIKMLQGI